MSASSSDIQTLQHVAKHLLLWLVQCMSVLQQDNDCTAWSSQLAKVPFRLWTCLSTSLLAKALFHLWSCLNTSLLAKAQLHLWMCLSTSLLAKVPFHLWACLSISLLAKASFYLWTCVSTSVLAKVSVPFWNMPQHSLVPTLKNMNPLTDNSNDPICTLAHHWILSLAHLHLLPNIIHPHMCICSQHN